MREHLPVEKEWNYRLVVWPIILMMTLFLIWASLSEVDELVHGQGKVIPSSQTKILQHLEGGIVEKIYVQEGARVKKGDPIYRLKNSSSRSDTLEKEITLKSLRLKEKRLQAQIDFQKSFDLNDTTAQAANEKAIFESEMQNYDEQERAIEQFKQGKILGANGMYHQVFDPQLLSAVTLVDNGEFKRWRAVESDAGNGSIEPGETQPTPSSKQSQTEPEEKSMPWGQILVAIGILSAIVVAGFIWLRKIGQKAAE